MFGEARQLASRHPFPEFEAIPDLRDGEVIVGLPTEYAIDASARALVRRSVDVSGQPQIIVVSHPSCHFSRAAMGDIQGDPTLSAVFRAHAKWLAPQSNWINFDTLQQWNHDHPDQPIGLTVASEDWAMIDSWGTPTFYFFKEGRVHAKVEGWPRSGRRAELLAALRVVGLLQ